MDGDEITWINWQAASTFVPVGTKVQVTRTKDKASLVNMETKAAYKVDIGAARSRPSGITSTSAIPKSS